MLLALVLGAAHASPPGPEFAAGAGAVLATGGLAPAPRGGLSVRLPAGRLFRVGFAVGQSAFLLDDPAAWLDGFDPTEDALAGRVRLVDAGLLLGLDGQAASWHGPAAHLGIGAILGWSTLALPTAQGRDLLTSFQAMPAASVGLGWWVSGAGRWTLRVGAELRGALAFDRSEGPGADRVGTWVAGGPTLAVGVRPF